ncbi:Oligosaccharide translocation protein rft1 [Rhizophlyctis rosea]|uniref:Man(5)GlcNAc(2)-PP-dolichol translocation protein RFT1 n=1 Tax=Rhizophlyctis rosea TaxID=64517 RepID=A0AAD5X6K2_9FUNG|nr:Oligosaccharide translocation protein rft1 [Rhizophlyctis rosea]
MPDSAPPHSKQGAAPANHALSSSLQGAAYLLILQFTSRIGTFVLNNLIQRRSTLAAFGQVSDLELYYSTVLFLSRENIRMALLRSSSATDSDSGDDAGEVLSEQEGVTTSIRKRRGESTSPKQYMSREQITTKSIPLGHQKLVNLSLVPFILGLLLTSLFCLYRVIFSSAPIPYLSTYFLAALIELISEPLYIIIQTNLLYNIRVKIEGLALLAKCATTLVYSYIFSPPHSTRHSVKAFALGQLVYAIVLLGAYVQSIQRPEVGRKLLRLDSGENVPLWNLFMPRKIADDKGHFYLDPYLASIAWTFTGQSALKHVLTEGDKMLLGAFQMSEEQKGAYKLVSDLGSLIARILYQPLEEMARAYFSKTLTSHGNSETKKHNFQQSISLLSTLLRAHILLGLYFVFLAPNYTTTLVQILYGTAKASTDIPSVLATYCYYVPLMGFNGIAEGFVQGVSDTRGLQKQSGYMVGFSVVFALIGYLTMVILKLGSVGLILANMINMALRSGIAYRYIKSFFLGGANGLKTVDQIVVKHDFMRQLTVSRLLPQNPAMWVGFVISCGTTYWSKAEFEARSRSGMLLHAAFGGLAGIVVSYLV